MTPEAAVNLRLGKIIGVGKAQIVGEARKARRRNDLQNVICQLLPAPSNLPLWLCLASYVEKNIAENILIRYLHSIKLLSFVLHLKILSVMFVSFVTVAFVPFSGPTNINCKQRSLF